MRPLIVGAGPTGQALAAVLATRGVAVRLIDRARGRSDRSRALVVQPRTLELLDTLSVDGQSLAERLVAVGTLARATNLWVDGRHVLHAPVHGSGALDDTAYPWVLFVSQEQTEAVLDAYLRHLGVRIEWETALVGLSLDESGVDVQIEGPDGVSRGRHPYVLGCDGAHSVVRKAAGLSFPGAAYPSDFLLGDVVVRGFQAPDGLTDDEIHVFLARDGFSAFFPLPGERTRVMVSAAAGATKGEPLGLAELTERASGLTGQRLRLTDPTWLSRFHLHHRGVPRYRVGRAFVAGDAAHIHSPAGGQGMNTGIQDAWNLGWKLAMVLHGEASPELLDTYDAERRPVGERLLRMTDLAFSAATSENQAFTTLRNLVVPLLAPQMATASRRARVIRFVSQLGVRYRGGGWLGEDLRGRVSGPGPGERAPDVRLGEGSLLRSLRGGSWWVVALCGAEERVDPRRFRARLEGACAGYPWIAVRTVAVEGADLRDPASAVQRVYGFRGPGVVLVRPDGHIAFRSDGARADPLAGWLEAHFPAL